jgi:hypothetical protein
MAARNSLLRTAGLDRGKYVSQERLWSTEKVLVCGIASRTHDASDTVKLVGAIEYLFFQLIIHLCA